MSADETQPGPEADADADAEAATEGSAPPKAKAKPKGKRPKGGSGPKRVLVTGGAGYFGTEVVDQVLARGDIARVFDLHTPDPRPGLDDRVEVVQGDIRDREAIVAACDGVDVVQHNVAQVPLAKDHQLFWSVNVVGTANLLLAAKEAGVGKVVYTSSSAVFGVPDTNPVTEETPPKPVESYGRAKLEGELLCHQAAEQGLDVSIIRPRTILGHGRLGIMAILFEFVAEGAPVYVIGDGSNRYQFVHATDLASACLLAGDRPGPETYNVGAPEFGTMRETLQALCDHAGTGSRVRSIPKGPSALGMKVVSLAGFAPFAEYHWKMYGESLWFDVTKAETELGWKAGYDYRAMIIESYEWFLANRDTLGGEGRSHHQSPAKLGLLKVLKRLP